ncbi:hypothetical protein KUCAC02_016009, partial [Chaenocephalus aceratus]
EVRRGEVTGSFDQTAWCANAQREQQLPQSLQINNNDFRVCFYTSDGRDQAIKNTR